MAAQLDLTIAICTYNRAKYLKKCIDSVMQQTLSPDRYEVMVIDNNSSDETAEVVQSKIQQYSGRLLRYYVEMQQGLSYARNRAMQEGLGKYIAFIDDDAYADSQWASLIVEHFETVIPKPICVGGKILLDWEGEEPIWASHYRALFGYLNHGRTMHLNMNFLGINGGNMAFDRDFILKCGYSFPVSLGRKGDSLLYGEESALINRLLADNAPIFYIDDATVWHVVLPERRSYDWLVARMTSHGYSQPLADVEQGTLSENTVALMRRVAFDFRTYLAWNVRSLIYRLKRNDIEHRHSQLVGWLYWGRVMSETRILLRKLKVIKKR